MAQLPFDEIQVMAYNMDDSTREKEWIKMEKLLGILKSLRSDVDFETETLLVDNGVLDSFDIISLVSELNDAYGIQISVVDLVPENFNSVQAMAALIARLA
jgi:acyl carrier protein